MRNNIKQCYLKECLTYTPETGDFIWNKRPDSHFADTYIAESWNKRYSNKSAGCFRPDGYRIISIGHERYLAHRLAYLYVTGNFPENLIDHIDKNKSNNIFSNLRDVDKRCNAQNSKAQGRNKFGVAGVRWENRDEIWSSCIGIEQKTKHLGSFDVFEDAVFARYLEEVNNPKWDKEGESSACRYLMENGFERIKSNFYARVKKLRKNNNTGVIGIKKVKNEEKWIVAIGGSKNRVYLGYFSVFSDAVLARYKGELKLFGEDQAKKSTAYRYLKSNGLI